MIYIFNDDFSFVCDSLEKSTSGLNPRTKLIACETFIGSVDFNKFYLKFSRADNKDKFYILLKR